MDMDGARGTDGDKCGWGLCTVLRALARKPDAGRGGLQYAAPRTSTTCSDPRSRVRDEARLAVEDTQDGGCVGPELAALDTENGGVGVGVTRRTRLDLDFGVARVVFGVSELRGRAQGGRRNKLWWDYWTRCSIEP
ncbi:hypothetical protein B0H12DRAFT_1108215 [Mycena haematopus]|nr:hypothetical protein B0H12DRAFT_1108215 [Mycena haematopus]